MYWRAMRHWTDLIGVLRNLVPGTFVHFTLPIPLRKKSASMFA